jgi:hypothetical protein
MFGMRKHTSTFDCSALLRREEICGHECAKPDMTTLIRNGFTNAALDEKLDRSISDTVSGSYSIFNPNTPLAFS